MNPLDLNEATLIILSLGDLGGLVSHDIRDDIDAAKALIVANALGILNTRHDARIAQVAIATAEAAKQAGEAVAAAVVEVKAKKGAGLIDASSPEPTSLQDLAPEAVVTPATPAPVV